MKRLDASWFMIDERESNQGKELDFPAFPCHQSLLIDHNPMQGKRFVVIETGFSGDVGSKGLGFS
jgi:hypothetical protein